MSSEQPTTTATPKSSMMDSFMNESHNAQRNPKEGPLPPIQQRQQPPVAPKRQPPVNLTELKTLPPRPTSPLTRSSSHPIIAHGRTTTQTMVAGADTTPPHRPEISTATTPPSSIGRFQITEVKSNKSTSSSRSSSTASQLPNRRHSHAITTTSPCSSSSGTPNSSDSLSMLMSIPTGQQQYPPSMNTSSGGAPNNDLLKSLATQVKNIQDTTSKQMKILNALYAQLQSNSNVLHQAALHPSSSILSRAVTAQQTSVSSSANPSTGQQNPTGGSGLLQQQEQPVVNILNTLEELQNQVNHLSQDNLKYKEENLQLRVELDRYKQQMKILTGARPTQNQ